MGLGARIEVEGLYKQYRLGEVGTGSVMHDLNRWWHRTRGKEDPYEKVTQRNEKDSGGSHDYVWALQDINFSLGAGETLGIIGKNGAGKSTLLKLLSKVTSPTRGKIKINGRIASLLEVGTGFHPELSGRDNIFLNGAILGMTRQEIKSKFDEIVAFSGVGRYIDTPVKRYSSGMYVRLGFAVAAHLESEILIVDEVLAVGDADFQKKCLGKMDSLSKGEGRTVLFVSHNIPSIKALCKKGLLMKNGESIYFGEIEPAINQYLKTDQGEAISLKHRSDREGNGRVQVTDICIKNKENQTVNSILAGEYTRIEFSLIENEKVDFSKMIVACSLSDPYTNHLVSWVSDEMEPTFTLGMEPAFSLEIPHLQLRPGEYSLSIQISFGTTAREDLSDYITRAASLEVEETDYFAEGKTIRSAYSALIPARFKIGK
jgi:lipopolysaccharide transport system ATP-binding protein